ncbi:ABC transporter permease [Mycoplana dimorpha]|uniref:Peptide/nickel transport system permease protein n=1 Tax=Mycoplana dimorpha TaxID=28320 RepID=A0A2T5B3J2_MYCDI|nr:ABC transporter permease [Mycoplana dimorpha]PTM93538.1 peptide/nickel transport system permease protein [Mycoplana dimorpha]
MLDFLARRIFGAAATLLVVVTAVFFATRLSGNAMDYLLPPGIDPETQAAMVARFGLDQPLLVQFGNFIAGLFQGDMGLSLYERRPVTAIYAERLPNTLELFFYALVLSVVVGLPLGVAAALQRKNAIGAAIMGVAFLGYATPNFVLAIVMILVFSFKLHWLPSSGSATPLHLLMPAIVLAAPMLAEIIRFSRNALLDVMSQDYLRTARAKGLPEHLVIGKHALRNAAIPVVTVIGLQVAGMVARCVLVEAVFATKGIGDLVVFAAIGRDYPVLQFGVILIATLVVTVSLVVDLLYVLIDPRVKVTAS